MMTEDSSSPGSTKPGRTETPHSWARLWTGLCIVIVGALVAAVLTRRYLDTRPLDLETHTVALADTIEDLLVQSHVPREHIDRRPGVPRRDQVTSWYWHAFNVDVPETLSVRGLERLIRKAMAQRHATVAAVSYESGQRCISLSVAGRVFAEVVLSGTDASESPETGPVIARLPETLPGLATLPLESSTLDLRQERLGGRGSGVGGTRSSAYKRVAIIIDDGGYGGPATEAILGLDPRLTLAILPYTPYAQETAKRAAAMGFEVMVHMPMESENSRLRCPGVLNTTATRDEIIALTEAALEDVPGAAGMNNHAGSKFTADREYMELFLELLKVRSLYFVDSYTSTESKVIEIGAALGVPVVRRDVFLDNRQDREHIIAQFDNLIEVCLDQGKAVGICHFRPVTASVLPELLAKLEDEGITLIHVSELAR